MQMAIKCLTTSTPEVDESHLALHLDHPLPNYVIHSVGTWTTVVLFTYLGHSKGKDTNTHHVFYPVPGFLLGLQE